MDEAWDHINDAVDALQRQTDTQRADLVAELDAICAELQALTARLTDVIHQTQRASA